MATTASGARILDEHNVTPLHKVYEPKQNRQNDYYNNNNNNNNPARARVDREADAANAAAFDAVMHGDFGSVYEDALCRPMPRFVAQEIGSMMQRGVSGSLILAVIEYTASAPRPSWAYARAVILRNWAKGINDDESFLDSLGR
jgi:hypothetical protein